MATIADRINVATMIYLACIVNEVKLKLEADSVVEHSKLFAAFRKQKKWIYAAYIGLVVPSVATYIAR